MSDAPSGTRRRGYGRGATELGSIATASVIDDEDLPRRDMMGLWNPNGEVSCSLFFSQFNLTCRSGSGLPMHHSSQNAPALQ
jgi:hypothetical protein